MHKGGDLGVCFGPRSFGSRDRSGTGSDRRAGRETQARKHLLAALAQGGAEGRRIIRGELRLLEQTNQRKKLLTPTPGKKKIVVRYTLELLDSRESFTKSEALPDLYLSARSAQRAADRLLYYDTVRCCYDSRSVNETLGMKDADACKQRERAVNWRDASPILLIATSAASMSIVVLCRIPRVPR